MSQLEIFQDASVYTGEIIPVDNMINIPLDIQDVSTFVQDANKIIPVQSQLVVSGLLEETNFVTVTDKYGNTVKGSLVGLNNEATVVSEGRTIIVKKPIIIQTIAQGKIYQIDSAKNSVILKGINPKVSWSPLYNFHINEKDELINMNLLGIIQNVGQSFDVSRLILSLKNYYGTPIEIQPQYRQRPKSRAVQESMLVAAPMPVSPEGAEEMPRAGDESKTYAIERHIRLTREVNMPLWNKTVNFPRTYFFFIGDTKIYYGYEIHDIGNEFFPAGIVRVFNGDGSAIKQFNTTGSLKKHVRFLIDQSLDIQVTPNVQTNNQGVVEFTLIVNSSKPNPIHLRIIQKVSGARNYKRIISDNKPIEDRDWNEILWDYQINYGINEIKGAFTIVYS